MADFSDYEQLTRKVKEDLQKGDLASAAAQIQKYREKEKNIPLNIAITGESGSGKSTFVNVIRGVDNRDEGAAPTGAVETTKEATPYPHPNYPNVVIWDLPGIGTVNHPAADYLKKVGFEKYDFFIIISADRFTENDVKLAKEIRRMGKKFYFVRSKIDNCVREEGRSQRNFNEAQTLNRIRENCFQGLQGQGFRSPQVFLISSFELHLYDFPLLLQTLERELPEHKRDTFLLAMPNISLEVINKKKKAFYAKIALAATLSAAVGAAPVPGLSVAVDIAIMVGVIRDYLYGFGLDAPSLRRLANCTGVPLDELKTVIKSQLAAKEVTAGLVLKLLLQLASMAGLMAAEEAARLIPMLGIVASSALSFTTTFGSLYTFLNELAEDAQRVFQKALGCNTTG
ncbi:interferon-inducible GTPase 5-like isoform X1 [Notolabrus celidotus]|uniref:interferon-inducible GTPase 5-like isoform X1 n=1 Tax=Notolabrus celidotus TaxID=1203425 RepID=UPI00149089AA|nr:interferon-inducible GTPase 5-like isoform X1 [Notolabrus celidotus]